MLLEKYCTVNDFGRTIIPDEREKLQKFNQEPVSPGCLWNRWNVANSSQENMQKPAEGRLLDNDW